MPDESEDQAPAAGARLDALRTEIADTDRELVHLLGRRLRLAREIGALKADLRLPVMDPGREAEVVRRAAEFARENGVDPELVRSVLWRVIDAARHVQEG